MAKSGLGGSRKGPGSVLEWSLEGSGWVQEVCMKSPEGSRKSQDPEGSSLGGSRKGPVWEGPGRFREGF